MFILVFLLIILSISRVWLMPTVASSELSGTIKDNDSRFKRQTAFFDLLHQAIEKYANCADTHLAPLKALANYKQYETFAYPEGLYQPSPPIMGHTNLNQHENRRNIKCTKVNLCSIQNQISHSTAGYNEHALNTGIDVAKQKLTPYFSHNINDKIKIPISGINHHGFKNKPAEFGTNYSIRNNFTHFPLNQAILNGFLYGPTFLNRKKPLKDFPVKNTGTETTPGSALKTTASSVQMNNCPCLEVSTASPENNKDAADKKEVLKTLDKTTTESLLYTKFDTTTAVEKVKGCLCEKETHQKPAGSNKTEPENLLPISSHGDKKSSQESAKWNQNLNLLFQQLDEIAHKVNNEDLKEMLEKLKTFKSAFKINSTHKECADTHPTTTTTTKSPVKKGIFTIIKEKLFGGARLAKTESSKTSTDLRKDNSKAMDSINNENLHELNSTQINKTNDTYSSSSLEPTKPITKLPETVANTATLIKTTSLLNESNTFQNVAAIKSAYLALNDSRIKDSIETATNSKILRTNLANSQDLLRIKEILTSTSSRANKNTQTDYQSNYTEIKGVKTQDVSSKSNQTLSYNDSQLETLNLLATTLNKSLGLITPTSNQNDTKITISITSDGNFKNIQVEQKLATDKNLEINERENMNMATKNSKARSVDMMGTGSRYVNILKQPEKKGPFAEPILSEIYSRTSRFRTKAPLSIYWHKIEEKPLKLKRIPSEVLKAFQSADIEDDSENNRNSNEEYISNMLKKGIDCEDIPYTDESESWLLT